MWLLGILIAHHDRSQAEWCACIDYYMSHDLQLVLLVAGRYNYISSVCDSPSLVTAHTGILSVRRCNLLYSSTT